MLKYVMLVLCVKFTCLFLKVLLVQKNLAFSLCGPLPFFIKTNKADRQLSDKEGVVVYINFIF